MRGSRARPGAKKHKRGVILLDVILALAIAGLLAAIMLPRIDRGLSPNAFAAESLRAASFLRAARIGAMQKSGQVDVDIDVQARELSAGGKKLKLDPRIMMTWVASDQCPYGMRGRALRFLGDGRSCAGVLTLRAPSGATALRVDWFTGRVEHRAL